MTSRAPGQHSNRRNGKLEAPDWQRELTRLQAKCDEVGRVIAERKREKEPTAEELAEARVRERLHRLRSAGAWEPDCLQVISEAKRPPVVSNHPGNRVAWRAVLDFLRDPDTRTLVLYGSTGTGKDWACAWAVAATENAVVEAAPALVPNADGDALLKRCRGARLVVFRDVGLEQPHRRGAVVEALCPLVDAGVRLIVTTNKFPDPDEVPEEHFRHATIKGLYGVQLHDRLLEGDKCRNVHVPGDSLRRGRR